MKRAAVVPLLVALSVSAAPAQPVPEPASAAMEKGVHDRVNAVRKDAGLPALAFDERLSEVARDFSCRLARDDFFGHVSPSGQTLTDRVRAAGRELRAAAENVAKNTNVRQPAQRAVEGWMQSSVHRANILSLDYTVTGIGACVRGPSWYFTQIFLLPR
jgi:uncharacterized protein YkwD